jgi:dipeptidyl aminopeptidase/acylaminoacyl peptidase
MSAKADFIVGRTPGSATGPLAGLAVALIALVPAWAAERPAKLTLDDLVSAEGIAQPKLSPDGHSFALVRQGQIALVPAEGGWPTTLTTTAGGKSGLDWSPDGRFIAYSSGGSIWSVPSGGGQPVRLTEGGRSAGDPRRAGDRSPQWSPKGNWILYETSHGEGSLAVVSADGLATNLLAPGSAETEQGSAAWSPDGTRIAFVERSPEYFSGRLRLAEFDAGTGRLKGEPKVLYQAPDDRGGGWSIRRPEWSPNGKSLALVLQGSGWDKIYLLPIAGGTPRAITDGESEDDSPAFSPDGKWLAFVSNREKPEERHVWVTPADGGQPRRLVSAPPEIESGPQWSPDSRQVYFLTNSTFESPSLAAAPVEGGSAPRILIRTQPRNFAATGLDGPETIHYKSKDGLGIAALLYKPAGFKQGNRYPAVLWIHGGPEGQDIVGWDPWALYLAQNGYLVLKPNYRGSSGYGEKFRNLNVEDSGGGEVDDVATGAEYLVSQGLADPARIGIGGGSHGGTMVAYAVTKHPGLFKAAVELYGVTDRASYIERTNRNAAIRWMRKMGGTPDQKPEVYRKANILPDVPKITAPLLIMHGDADPQVPPYESQQFVNALKKAGKVHVYVTYPKELHGFAQREHRLDAWRKQVAFLSRYLQPEYGRSITSTSEIVLDEK